MLPLWLAETAAEVIKAGTAALGRAASFLAGKSS